jgi:hypothetical protein
MRTFFYILAGIVVFLAFIIVLSSTNSPSFSNDRKSITKNDVMQLSVALLAYQSEYGNYPDGTFNSILDQLAGNNPKRIVFIELDKSRFNSNGFYLDPWKQPYRIDLQSSKRPYVWSIGKDGTNGFNISSSDDIRSWE